jgi:hypothetical protein
MRSILADPDSLKSVPQSMWITGSTSPSVVSGLAVSRPVSRPCKAGPQPDRQPLDQHRLANPVRRLHRGVGDRRTSAYYWSLSITESALLLLIVWYAWTWPSRQGTPEGRKPYPALRHERVVLCRSI